MKAVILCGGKGTRIRDVSEILPKPMLPIGGKPILWHIMKIYAHHGIKDFVLCLGYKGWVIKEFFLNYYAKTMDLSIDFSKKDSLLYHGKCQEEDWRVTLVETGESAQTGARIWNARNYLKDCDSFCVTYGDGVADVDIKKLLEEHKKSQRLATVTAVHPSGRFGEMEIRNGCVSEFNEKPNVSTGMINGGFMVFQKEALEKYFRDGDDLILEIEVLARMAKDKKLNAYQHDGFWQCVDTIREHNILNDMHRQGNAVWEKWK